MDKLVSIKGLVIRTTPVIPDMKTGKSFSHLATALETIFDPVSIPFKYFLHPFLILSSISSTLSELIPDPQN